MRTTEVLISSLRARAMSSSSSQNPWRDSDLFCEAADRLEELQKEVERLNSCVKTEDEVKAIARETIRQELSNVVNPYEEEIKRLTELNKQLRLLYKKSDPRRIYNAE